MKNLQASITIIILLIDFIESQDVVIDIPDLGIFQGRTDVALGGRTFYKFYSIRYAMIPWKTRRFMPPAPFSKGDGYEFSGEYVRPCLQILPEPMEVQDEAEDCLMLNIFTPWIPQLANETVTKSLPVLFFIHGGGFIMGSAEKYKPHYLLKHDVVLVTIQYRLGALGFLSLDTDGMPGNVGLLDQLEALRFVNKYIGYFGGNNTRVTLFGHGSGGSSIVFHLMSPIMKNESHLFQQVIIQSGSAFSNNELEDNPEEIVQGIYKTVSGKNENADHSKMEDALKSAHISNLYQAAHQYHMRTGRSGKPVIQKVEKYNYLPKLPSDYLVTEELRALPMMIGVTKDDGTFLAADFYDKLKRKGLENNEGYLRFNLTSDVLEEHNIGLEDETESVAIILNTMFFKKIFSQPKRVTFADLAPGIIDILSMFSVKGQTLKHAKANAKYHPSTYLYSFEYRGNHSRFEERKEHDYPFKIGTTRGDDLIYLFPLFQLDENDIKMAEIMTEMWANFAKYGIPTSPESTLKWPTFKKDENGPFLRITNEPYVCDNFISKEFLQSLNHTND